MTDKESPETVESRAPEARLGGRGDGPAGTGRPGAWRWAPWWRWCWRCPPFPSRPTTTCSTIGTNALMWVTLASSWNVLAGYTGYISLGHNVFFGIGGYAAGIGLAYWGISPFISAPITGLIAMVIGLAIGLITWRAKGPSFIVATIAMLFVVGMLFDNWEFVGASAGMSLPSPPFPVDTAKVPFYYAMAVCAFGAVYLAYRVSHSRFGLGLRALSQDETKAEVAGINTRLYKLIAMSLSAFFIAVRRRHLGLLALVPASDHLLQHRHRHPDAGGDDHRRTRNGRRARAGSIAGGGDQRVLTWCSSGTRNSTSWSTESSSWRCWCSSPGEWWGVSRRRGSCRSSWTGTDAARPTPSSQAGGPGSCGVTGESSCRRHQ